MIEKNSGVGGTWFENRYPGARVDSPSRTYTHTFGADYEYPNPFCEQSENEKYFNWVADEFGVRESIEFDTEVKSVIWDEDAKVWEIDSGRARRAADLARQRGDQWRGLPGPSERPEHRGPGDVRGPGLPHRPVAGRPRPHRQARRGDRQRVHQLPDDARARRDGRPHLPLPAHPQLVLRRRWLSVAVPAASELAGSELPLLHELHPIPDQLAVRPGQPGCRLHRRSRVQGRAREKRGEQAGS